MMQRQLPPATTYILVDFENIQFVDPVIFDSQRVHLTLLLGAKNTKLEVPLVEKLVEHAAMIELVRLTSSGRNALDFALAYYLGHAVHGDPRGQFHLVSKDTGYDPLIEHLRSRHIDVWRHEDFAFLHRGNGAPVVAGTDQETAATVADDISSPPAPRPKASEAGLASVIPADHPGRILHFLRALNCQPPKTEKSLIRWIIPHLGQKVTEAEAASLVQTLQQNSHISIDENSKVTYHVDGLWVRAAGDTDQR